jgi:hypothetical protein
LRDKNQGQVFSPWAESEPKGFNLILLLNLNTLRKKHRARQTLVMHQCKMRQALSLVTSYP